MGVAIIFIMASHTLGGYAAYGIIGVEWFLVLSAIGQYYSLKKNDNKLTYYKRRLIRILPAYLIVAIPFFLIKYPSSFQDFLIRLTGLNLFIWGEKLFWFVTLIIICYLIAPLYFKIVNNVEHSVFIPFILSGIFFILSFHTPKSEILLTRIPIFLLGMNLAKYVYEGQVIEDRNKVRTIAAISIISVFLLLTIYIDGLGIEYVRVIYFLCGIPTLLFVLSVAKRLPFLKGALSFLGSISYELYLVHQHVALAICLMLPFPRFAVVLLSYALAVILAYLLHLAVNLLTVRQKER